MNNLVIITGPTAVGKTEISIELAKAINGEIISADSIQVYKYMDIGSAKIKKEEMDGVRHHLIDVLDPEEEFHVVRFQQMAKEAMKEIYAAGHIPIIAGGTGFYIQALLYDIDFSEENEDMSIRNALEALAETRGAEYLHEELARVDPESAEQIHANNVKRVIRALEYYRMHGEKISLHNENERQKTSPYDFFYFVLTHDRQVLYDRIEKRIDLMLRQGLVEEVRGLMAKGYDKNLVSMQGLGYKEILAYLDREMPLEEAVRILKRDTRHFAKRQLTWFRRELETLWINKDEFGYDDGKMLEYMLSICREKGILG